LPRRAFHDGTECAGGRAGAAGTATAILLADAIRLDGVGQITVPFLIIHGENDRPIPCD
jgi:pimeloyl-ACP methyl ester carboxylesterase